MPSSSCRHSGSPTCGAVRRGWAGASGNSAGPRSPCSSRAAGGSPSSNCGRRARAPTSAAAPTTRSSTSFSGTTGSPRIFGSGGGGAGGGTTSGTSSAFGGGEGLLRMFDSELGGQISWLLPVALVGLVGGLWLTRRHGRADSQRSGFVLWGGTLLMFLAVYDYAKGIFHPYYTVVMAPATAALVGAGAVALWRLGRQSRRWSWVLPATIVGTVVWADALLARTSGYDSWLGPTVVVTGVISALLLFLSLVRPKGMRWLALLAGTVAVVSVLAGPAAYSLTTLGTTTSAIATAGPTSGAGALGGGGGPGSGGPGGSGLRGRPATAGTKPSAGGPSSTGSAPAGARLGATTDGGGGGGGAGAASTVDTSLVQYLEKHQGSATYLVAVNGSQSAGPFILESGKAVIAMGGFGGSDPAPTLSEFKQLVASGKVHYVYVSGGSGSTAGAGGAGFGGDASSPGVRTTASTTTAGTAGTREHKTDGSGGSGEQCQRRRCLGREARDQGLRQRLWGHLDGRDPLLHRQRRRLPVTWCSVTRQGDERDEVGEQPRPHQRAGVEHLVEAEDPWPRVRSLQGIDDCADRVERAPPRASRRIPPSRGCAPAAAPR